MTASFQRILRGVMLWALGGSWAAFAAPPLATIGPSYPTATASAATGTIEGDDVRVDLTVPTRFLQGFGFIPVRMTIRNTQKRELEWTVTFQLVTYLYQSTWDYTERVVVPADRTTERWIFIPSPRRGGVLHGDLLCTIGGPGIAHEATHLPINARGIGAMPPWAVSATIETKVRLRIEAAKLGFRAAQAKTPALEERLAEEATVTPFDPAALPADWRGWSQYSRVVMPADEYAGLLPAERRALDNWVALGGSLYLAPAEAAPAATQGHGAGAIVRMAGPIDPRGGAEEGRLFSWGGLYQSSLAVPGEALGLNRSGLADALPGRKPIGDWLGIYFIFFAAAIGPLNLFLLAPARRRHRLFLTVPAISLAAVLLLLGWILLRDGLGGQGVRLAIVDLLPGENQAAIFQEQTSTTGLLVGRRFPLADDTLCADVPMVANEAGYGNAAVTRRFSRQAGVAAGDWFRSRELQAQHLRRITPTRARVERVGTEAGGAPIVQSSVGTPLRNFRYLDTGGKTWTARTVPPGQRVTLQPATDDITIERQAAAFAWNGSELFHGLARAAVTDPANWTDGAPGHFVAEADENELAPIPTLGSIRWRQSQVLYTGVVEGTVAGGKEAR